MELHKEVTGDPTRPSVVLEEDKVLTADLDEVKSRWHRHFSRLLNIPSSLYSTGWSGYRCVQMVLERLWISVNSQNAQQTELV